MGFLRITETSSGLPCTEHGRHFDPNQRAGFNLDIAGPMHGINGPDTIAPNFSLF